MGGNNHSRTHVASREEDDIEAQPNGFASPIAITPHASSSNGGGKTKFEIGLESVNKAIPGMKADPDAVYFVESHTKCEGGNCKGEACMNIRVAEERSMRIVRHLTSNGCRNSLVYKSWGCRHPDVCSKDLIRISKIKKPEPAPAPAPEPEPEPIVAAPALAPEPEPVVAPAPAPEPEAEPEPEPVAVPVPVPVPVTEKQELKAEIEAMLDSKDITFGKNSPELDEEGRETCDHMVPWFKKHPEMEINVESHTDCIRGKCKGGCKLKDLSQERVDAVRAYFMAQGCKNIFLTKGWGCTHPVLRNIRLVRLYPSDDVDDAGNPHESAKALEPVEVPGNAKSHVNKFKIAAMVTKTVMSAKDKIKQQIVELMDDSEITFEKNSPDLDDDGKAVCENIAGYFIGHPEMEINIESHTNCFKSKCQHQCTMVDLSQKRCDKVKAYFFELGCKNIIFAKGWGCKHPKYGRVRMVRIFPTDDVDDNGVSHSSKKALMPISSPSPQHL
jgi:outer membrane protein OmpA-like peptidoglycan-associated protein